MPLYEYKCHSCGKTFEVRQKFADEPLTTHPDCGGAVERLISPPAFQFKGTGWYVTDYGKGNGKSAADPGKTDDTSKADKPKTEGGSSSSAAESKPAATESKPASPSSSDSR